MEHIPRTVNVAVTQCTNYRDWPVASYVHVVNRNLECYCGSQASWPDTVTVRLLGIETASRACKISILLKGQRSEK